MIAKILLAAWLLMMPFVTMASQDPVEVDSGRATILFECEIRFKPGREIQILDCEIVGLEPRTPDSGE